MKNKPYIINGERVSHSVYASNRYDDLRVRVPAGQKKIIKKHADKKDMSINAYVWEAVSKQMSLDEK